MARGRGGGYDSNVVMVTTRARSVAPEIYAGTYEYEPMHGVSKANRISSENYTDNQALHSASKRHDRALLNDITTRMYRLDFDSVGLSDDVKVKTGFRRHLYSKKVPLDEETKYARRRDELLYPWNHTHENIYRPKGKIYRQGRDAREAKISKQRDSSPVYLADYDPLGYVKRKERRDRELLRYDRNVELEKLMNSVKFNRTGKTAQEDAEEEKGAGEYKRPENLPLTHNSKALLAKLRAKSYRMENEKKAADVDRILDQVDLVPLRSTYEPYKPRYAEYITQNSQDYWEPETHAGTEGGLDPITRRRINDSKRELDNFEHLLNTKYNPRLNRYAYNAALRSNERLVQGVQRDLDISAGIQKPAEDVQAELGMGAGDVTYYPPGCDDYEVDAVYSSKPVINYDATKPRYSKGVSGAPSALGRRYSVPGLVQVPSNALYAGRTKYARDLEDRLDLEMETYDNLPYSSPTSYAHLRHKYVDAKNKMDAHRTMLDRYLPVYLGPENEVQYEVDYKFGELASRMPSLDPYRPNTGYAGGSSHNYASYTPGIPPKATNAYSRPPPPRLPVSDTRKRAREVLCKTKRDPNYFSY